MSLLRLSVTTAIVLCTPLYAHAAVDAAGAALLTQQITDSLKSMHQFETSGEVAVKPEGDAFMVTLPVITTHDSEKTATIVAGSIQLRMIPSTETAYKYSATLPTPFLTINDATGVPVGTVTVGEQQLSGEWDSKTHMFPNAISNLKNVVFNDAKKTVIASIGMINGISQMGPDAAGLLNTDITLNLSELQFATTKPDDTVTAKIAGIGISLVGRGQNMAAATQMREAISNVPDSKDPTAVISHMADIFSQNDNLMTGSSQINLTLSGLDVNSKTGTDEPVHVTLPALKLAVNAAADANHMVDMNGVYEHSGLSISPATGLIADLLPTAVKFDGGVVHMPVAEILKQTETLMPKEGAEPAKPAPNPQEQWKAMVAFLSKAQTAININQISYASKALTSMTKGNFHFIEASPIGITGTLDTQLNGVAELSAKLQQSMNATPKGTAPEAQPDPMAQEVAMGLGFVQMFGQPVAGATPSGLQYKLEVTPAGEVKLNGNDMSSMLGMAGGHAPKPAPAADEPFVPHRKNP